MVASIALPVILALGDASRHIDGIHAEETLLEGIVCHFLLGKDIPVLPFLTNAVELERPFQIRSFNAIEHTGSLWQRLEGDGYFFHSIFFHVVPFVQLEALATLDGIAFPLLIHQIGGGAETKGRTRVMAEIEIQRGLFLAELHFGDFYAKCKESAEVWMLNGSHHIGRCTSIVLCPSAEREEHCTK